MVSFIMVKWVGMCQVSQDVFLLTEWAFHFQLGQSLNVMFASLKKSPPPK